MVEYRSDRRRIWSPEMVDVNEGSVNKKDLERIKPKSKESRRIS